MLRVAVIADDLTGAADTGIRFCTPDAPTYLLGPGPLRTFRFPESPHSLSLYTNTRNVSAGQAGAAVRAAASTVKDLNPGLVYKKIDSCLRGNLGTELDVIAECLGLEASFVAPALPEQGRTVLHDVHYVRGVALADTEMARDPVSPVTESRVSVLLGRQSRSRIGRVDLDVLEGSPAGLIGHIRDLLRQGARHLVFDTATQTHLDRIAEIALKHFPGSLPAGSAGLASSVAALLSPGNPGAQGPARPVGNRILFVCGSASDVLGAQVGELLRFSGCSSLFLDPQDLAFPISGARISELAQAAGAELAARSVVLKIKPPARSSAKTGGEEILKGLSELVLSMMNNVRPDGIFLSGGDTAFSVLNALRAEAVLLGRELLSGFVLGTLCKGSFDGLPVVTKAGAFGASDALVRVYHMLSGCASIS